ncbi:aldehyde-activating protein [Sinorhizobium sp. GW3]|nr:aldehyde-activating protein [Sinorhizobium sp. GW3]
MTTLSGKCLCGRVALSVHGEPIRVGICHCMDCRKESGSAFTFYGIWPAEQFEYSGEVSDFQGRRFCSHCGSRVFSVDAREAEVKLGILSQAPTPLKPSYELWVKRREPWLRPVEGAAQYQEDRERTGDEEASDTRY